MDAVRVFVSFDGEHDEDLRVRLGQEAADPCSGFEIAARSERCALTEAWRRRIEASDEVIVVCAEHTHGSAQVAAEVELARETQKPYFLLWGRRDAMCTKPLGVRPRDGTYRWPPHAVRDRVTQTLRLARHLEVAERCKRP